MSNQNMQIPTPFVDFLRTRFGADADAWLAGIPSLLTRKLAEWNLTLESDIPLHGAMGLVFFVKQYDERLVMKISWRDQLTEQENHALKLWNGDGAVRLLAYDTVNHVSLMERLTNVSLADIDITDASVEAGKLIRRLDLKCEDGFQKLTHRAMEIQMQLSERKNSAQSAFDLDLISKIIAKRIPLIGSHLCHGDLGYLNVLQAYNKEWKAIDPKPIIGDLEFCIPELMWTRLDEIEDGDIVAHLERIVEAGSLDRQAAIDWTVIRSADYYFWAIDNGLTIDPKRCIRLYNALINEV
ncbi:MAG TPA: aminoglycoside phosphotransferase family protein [Candidatus Saccharimonadales bacterium]|nr:aminoglycoside phosphotransferase family protein [Candidatus Saccharimonadales bacterium]